MKCYFCLYNKEADIPSIKYTRLFASESKSETEEIIDALIYCNVYPAFGCSKNILKNSIFLLKNRTENKAQERI